MNKNLNKKIFFVIACMHLCACGDSLKENSMNSEYYKTKQMYESKCLSTKLENNKEIIIDFRDLQDKPYQQINFSDVKGLIIARYSPNGKYLAIRHYDDNDNPIRILEVETGNLKKEIHTKGYWYAMSYSADGKYLAFSNYNSNVDGIALISVDTDKIFKVLECEERIIDSIAFSPDGRYLAASMNSWYVGLRVWDIITGKVIYNKKNDSYKRATDLIYSPNGKYILSKDQGCGSFELFNVFTEKFVLEYPDYLCGNRSSCSVDSSLIFSPDSKYIASIGSFSSDKHNTTINIFDGTTSKLMRRFNKRTYDKALSFCLNDKYLLSAGRSDLLSLWDISTGDCLLNILGRLDDWDMAFFSPDRKYFVYSYYGYAQSPYKNCTIFIWNIEDILFFLKYPQFVNLKKNINEFYSLFPINPSMANRGSLAKKILLGLEDKGEGLKSEFKKFEERQQKERKGDSKDPNFKEKVDACLGGMLDRFREEKVKDFDIESLRPQVEMLVRGCEDLDLSKTYYDNESFWKKIKEGEERQYQTLAAIDARIGKGVEKKEEEVIKKEVEEEGEGTLDKTVGIGPAKPISDGFFIPEFRLYFLNEIREDIEDLEADLAILQFTKPLEQKFEKRFLKILDDISKQTKEIKYFYRSLKKIGHNADSSRIDVIDLKSSDIEKSSEGKRSFSLGKKALENEKERLRLEKVELEHTIEFPLIAKKLLIDLQEEKRKLVDILEKYNKTIQKSFSLEIDYDSDMENDYSSEELEVYLDSLKLKNINGKESFFLLSLKKNIDSELDGIVYLLGKQEYLSMDKVSELAKKLFSKIKIESKIEYDGVNVRPLNDLIFHLIVLKMKKNV